MERQKQLDGCTISALLLAQLAGVMEPLIPPAGKVLPDTIVTSRE